MAGGVVCGALATLKLWHDARRSAKWEASVLGVVFAEQTERSLQPVSVVMKDIATRVHAAHITTADAFRTFVSTSEFQLLLADKAADVPQASAIAVVSSDGALLNSSTSWPVPNVNVSDRGYAAYCSKQDHGPPFVGATVNGRSTDRLAFPLVQCLDGDHGNAIGIIVAGISVGYFMDFYRTIDLPPGSSLVVRHANGRALVRFPNRGPFVPSLDSPAVRTERFVARHNLSGYPIEIEVNFAAANAFAVWRGQVIWIVLGSTLVLACLSTLVAQLVGVVRRLERVKTALATRNRSLLAVRRGLETQAQALKATAEALFVSEARIVKQAGALEMTLEHMNQGIMMVAADRTVALCNRRAMEMLDLPPDLLLRHPSFAEVLEHQWQSEEFVFTSDDMQQFIRRGGILDQQHSYERQRPNGKVIEVCSVPLENGGSVRTYTDITLRKRAEERLTHLAYHDELTGLSNRYALREQVDKSIALAQETGDNLTLLYLDVDRFKLINDTCGHSAGDDVLKQVSRRLQNALRTADMAARLGGDEFAALLLNVADRDSALVHANSLKSALGGQYEVDGRAFRIGLSIGVAVYPRDGATTDQLLRSADSALYRAKAEGRDAVRLHENAAEMEDIGRMVLEQDLRTAVEQEQFELMYQPIFDSKTGLPSSCEALLRWRHPTRGLLSPDLFIPIAEETGLIKQIGHWVLRAACREAATWALPVRVAVNLSSVQFGQVDLEQQVFDALLASGLPANRLDLEVTESVLLNDTAHVRKVMLALQNRGVRLVMDDFGTGHSSLEALQGFPFQQIKIDRAFVAKIFDDDRAGAILPAVLTMATKMKLEVVVEGVATNAQVEALRDLGCRYMQGFLLARPQTPEWTRDYLWGCTTAPGENAAAAMAVAVARSPSN